MTDDYEFNYDIEIRGVKLKGQKMRIMKALSTGQELDRLQCLTELGVFEAPARISELRAMGVKISTRMTTITNRFGESTRVAKWKIG